MMFVLYVCLCGVNSVTTTILFCVVSILVFYVLIFLTSVYYRFIRIMCMCVFTYDNNNNRFLQLD